MDEILSEHAKRSPKPFQAAVLTAIDRNGKTLLSSSNGTLTCDPKSPSVNEDSIFWIASMSKIVTSVAVMIAVEKGLIGLDDDVGKIVPQLSEPEIIIGFDDNGEPQLRKAKNKLTLRHLLLHTSGYSHKIANDKLQRWAKYHDQNPGDDIDSWEWTFEFFDTPLVFEPGESWAYGPGPDWAGKVVEGLTNQTLDQFIQANICKPLGLTATTFHPESLSNFSERKVELAIRGDSGELKTGKSPSPIPPRDELGGAGLYSTPREFNSFLAALLAGGGGILSSESVDELFRPQLSDSVRKIVNDMFSTVPRGMRRGLTTANFIDQALGGCVNIDSVEGGRAKGCVSWSGYPNVYWWIDPQEGLCASAFFQLLPASDKYVHDIWDDFETELYRTVRS